jgi:diguanylate cyclase (GGDEF)-like protein/PAS domain S-box-containing protein
VWRQRHRWLVGVLWAHVAALAVFGAARGTALASLALLLLPIVVAAFAGRLRPLSPRVQELLVALGLLSAAAVLVRLWGGQSEAQAGWFVVLAALMLYEDWSLLALAIVFVLSHAIVRGGAWEPTGVPALFVAIVGAGGIVAARCNAALRKEAREATQRFHSSFDSAPIGMAIVCLRGRFVDVNAALCEIVGHSRETLLASSLQELTLPADLDIDAHLFRQMLAGGRRTSQCRKRFVHAGGHVIWVDVSLSFVHGGPGTPDHFIAQLEDVTERQRSIDQLQHLADHDALTGLLNRRRLEHEIEQQVALVERYDSHACLVLLDLDDFKSTNDSLGHAVGDELLQNVAEVLRGRVRRSDLVARLGGDEFAILLPQADVEHGRKVAEAVARAIRERVSITAGREVRMTASFGVSSIEPDDTPSRVLLRADRAMYAVKQHGRDGVEVSPPRPAPEPRD